MAPAKTHRPHCGALLSQSQINCHLAQEHLLEFQANSNDGDTAGNALQEAGEEHPAQLLAHNYVEHAHGVMNMLTNENSGTVPHDNDWFEPYDDYDEDNEDSKKDEAPASATDITGEMSLKWNSIIWKLMIKLAKCMNLVWVQTYSNQGPDICLLDNEYLTDADLNNIKAFSIKLSGHLSHTTHSKL
ncbi:hypothetical protein BS47DRAFT_1366632 [Hydnum rufescens UP504]|uniref:Uncharacterized protein n=1 Tax=Hydnum rufescens UP504 TaxID=1448309 RepID=A0A9P6AKF8_9AGAM|nr:hypothetical protein BS47DRAFT_1366632 [Hydnum rufescens UP504]